MDLNLEYNIYRPAVIMILVQLDTLDTVFEQSKWDPESLTHHPPYGTYGP